MAYPVSLLAVDCSAWTTGEPSEIPAIAPLASAIVIPTARFVTLLFGGLYAGFLLAVLFLEATLRGAAAEVYVVVQQAKHANLNLLAAATITPTIAGGALLLRAVLRILDIELLHGVPGGTRAGEEVENCGVRVRREFKQAT